MDLASSTHAMNSRCVGEAVEVLAVSVALLEHVVEVVLLLLVAMEVAMHSAGRDFKTTSCPWQPARRRNTINLSEVTCPDFETQPGETDIE